jgi:trehalose synthase
VVAGNVGGIPLQILYGKTGYLVNTTAECTNRVHHLLTHPRIADRMGQTGREHVREHFLITRYLRDYLTIFNTLDGRISGDGIAAAKSKSKNGRAATVGDRG